MPIRPDETLVLLRRIADRTGIGFDPPPRAVLAALPALIDAVDHALDEIPDLQDRQWLAAALAALQHRVQVVASPAVGTVAGPGDVPSSHRHPSVRW